MSDEIRDRVIKALLSIRCDLEEPCEECRILAVQDTDAVIGELGLRPDLGQRSKPTGPLWGANNRYNVTRYVTEWKNNDE